jgi:hypothetical protein
LAEHPLERQAIQPRHLGVVDQTLYFVLARGVEKCRGGFKQCAPISSRSDQATNGFADSFIIIHYADGSLGYLAFHYAFYAATID